MTTQLVAPTRTTTHAPRVADPPQLGLLGLVVVLIGSFLSQLDFFIVNVALPTIDRTLHASPAALELVVAGYGIAYAVLLVVGGRLGDAFGRRRLYLVGMAAFTLTSLACGLAPTTGILIAARVAQGVAAALLVPQVLATIQATTGGYQRAKAIGAYGAAAGISVVVGQLVGGLLVAADIAGWSWRPIFLVNVPIGIVGLIAAARILPDTRSPHPARVDRAGTVLLALALLALLVPLMEGRAEGWPWWSFVSLAAAPLLFAAFALVESRVEARGRYPLLPPSMLRIRSVRAGLSFALPFFAGFGGFMFVYSLALQQGIRMGPLDAGLALTPMALGFLAASLASARLTARFGRNLVTGGMIVQVTGLLALAGTVALAWPHLNPLVLTPAMLVAGLGQGSVASPLFRLILTDVPPALAGAGSGVAVTNQQSALALGVATLGSLFLSLGPALGDRPAFQIVLLIQAGIGLGLLALSRTLPDPHREATPRVVALAAD